MQLPREGPSVDDPDDETRDVPVVKHAVGAPAPLPSALQIGEPSAVAPTAHAPTAQVPRPMPVPGMRFGNYEIIRELARGGMGLVCLARDVKLGRRVAIKFILSGSSALAARFLIEAQATAQCHHENIVVIHDINEHQGMPYMVLEYLEGEPLSYQLKSERPLPVTRAVEIAAPVLRALAAAHDLGIVHRDLKPSNIFLTASGTVKVLDFGIAKMFVDQPARADAADRAAGNELDPTPPSMPGDPEASYVTLSRPGGVVGTRFYMAPEQWSHQGVDAASDLWGLGVVLFQMLAGIHPLDGTDRDDIQATVEDLSAPVLSLAAVRPDLPAKLVHVVDRCLRKRKEERYQRAEEVLEDLEEFLPGRYHRRLSDDESPYPGLAPFQETDADRFFGRAEEVMRAQVWLRDHPLVTLVGPSGAGKSSFVRAGLVPALKAAEPWEVMVMRPGRNPMANLINAVSERTWSAVSMRVAEDQKLAERLRSEQGFLGALLRNRAVQKHTPILLFVDQFEELYTLVQDPAERAAFTAALAGAADDAASPLRVVLSMRSDFLDRAAEDSQFFEELMRGLMFLQPSTRKGLREALTQPAEMAGHHFESAEMVDEMLAQLESATGALPLLQFAAARLWEERDRRRRLLTRSSYDAMGGVAGALATHADRVLDGLTAAGRKLAAAVLPRLVTPERTRAIVEVSELKQLSSEPGAVELLLNQLVDARLLVVQARGEADSAAVEIVHESLITRWPTLRRWLDEGQEDAAFLAQLGSTARQWDVRGRPAGLLWRGEASEEASRFRKRHRGELAAREREYLDAVESLATRAARIRRAILTGALAFLAVLVAAGAVALLTIRKAEKSARHAERDALTQAELAGNEAARARQAERKSKEQLDLVQRKEQERRRAQEQADEARTEVEKSKSQLQLAYEQLRDSFGDAEAARRRAEQAASTARAATLAERQAKAAMEKLLAREREQVKRLERERKKIGTELR
jgi:serine/threonine protein kinase